MIRPILLRAIALPLVLFVGNGCASAPEPAARDVGKLLDWVEEVYVEAELAREQMLVANELLQMLVQGRYQSDPEHMLAQYVDATQRSITQAEALSATIEPLKQAAQPFFASWVEDLNSFSSSTLWQRSQVRLMAARKRYDELLASLEAIDKSHTVFNRNLKDHALFLRNDFNESSLAAIRADARALNETATGLTADYDAYLLSSRTYLSNGALPRAIPVEAAAEGDGKPKAKSRFGPNRELIKKK